MKVILSLKMCNALFLIGALVIRWFPTMHVSAQGTELQQQVADLKQSVAQNKQQLAKYTYVEQITISIKGEQKKQERFQVRTGPDGKAQKTPIDQPATAAPPEKTAGRGGRIKEHVVEKKKEEYKDYVERMKSLMEQYVPPDKDLLQQALQNHKASLTPGTGSQVQLTFHDYVKPNDSMILVFDKDQKQLAGVQVASYLDDPQDAVNLTVKMARLPDGVTHVDSVILDGVSKHLNAKIQNSNYQHL